MIMSENESKFIRQLKITLISVLAPFIIVGTANAIVDHHRIKNNQQHIKAMEDTRVTREIMLLYVNDLREIQDLMRQDMEGQIDNAHEQISQINGRLDGLMRDIYEVKKRSTKLKDNL